MGSQGFHVTEVFHIMSNVSEGVASAQGFVRGVSRSNQKGIPCKQIARFMSLRDVMR